MEIPRILVTILGLPAIHLGASACDSAPASNYTIHADSGGIAIATGIKRLWAPGEGWAIEDAPLIEIGTISGAPDYQFTDVVAAVRLSNGNIVVADRGAAELRSYDTAGNFQWRAGRFGDGPGDFESLDFLGSTVADTLVAYDASLMRAQLFGPQGRLVRTVRVAITEGEAAAKALVPRKAVGVVDGLLIVRFYEYSDAIPTGIVRWPLEHLVALDLEHGTAKSLLVQPGYERYVRVLEGGGYSHGAYVFSNGPEYGTAPRGRLAVIDTESWLVRLVSPQDGSVMAVFRRDVTPREATTSLFDLHLDGVVKMAFSDAEQEAPQDVAMLRRLWRARPRAPTLPILRSVYLDATGHVWLRPYHVAGAEPPPFEIHAPDGTWLGSVSLPPGLQQTLLQYQAPYMDIGEDYLLGVWTDELDVQYVRMYRIKK